MRFYRPQTMIVLGIIAASALGCHSAHLTQPSGKSKVIRLSGAARYSVNPGKGWETLRLGDVILPGTLIQTSHNGDLFISVGNDSIPVDHRVEGGSPYDPFTYEYNLVRVDPDSVLRIRSQTRGGNLRAADPSDNVGLVLYVGSILGRVTKNQSNFEVRLTNSSIRLRSQTVYSLRANGQVAVVEGSADVYRRGRPSQVVSSLQSMDLNTGEVTNLQPIGDRLYHDIWLPSDPMMIPWADRASAGAPKGAGGWKN